MRISLPAARAASTNEFEGLSVSTPLACRGCRLAGGGRGEGVALERLSRVRPSRPLSFRPRPLTAFQPLPGSLGQRVRSLQLSGRLGLVRLVAPGGASYLLFLLPLALSPLHSCSSRKEPHHQRRPQRGLHGHTTSSSTSLRQNVGRCHPLTGRRLWRDAGHRILLCRAHAASHKHPESLHDAPHFVHRRVRLRVALGQAWHDCHGHRLLVDLGRNASLLRSARSTIHTLTRDVPRSPMQASHGQSDHLRSALPRLPSDQGINVAQSTAQGYKNGIVGPYSYACGAAVQIVVRTSSFRLFTRSLLPADTTPPRLSPPVRILLRSP